MPRGRRSSGSRSTRRSRATWELVDALNGYLTEKEPWTLAKDPHQRARLETVLATAYHGLGTLAVLLSPVMPKATEKLWTALGAPGTRAGAAHRPRPRVDRRRAASAPLEALFPRVEVSE